MDDDGLIAAEARTMWSRKGLMVGIAVVLFPLPIEYYSHGKTLFADYHARFQDVLTSGGLTFLFYSIPRYRNGLVVGIRLSFHSHCPIK